MWPLTEIESTWIKYQNKQNANVLKYFVKQLVLFSKSQSMSYPIKKSISQRYTCNTIIKKQDMRKLNDATRVTHLVFITRAMVC